MTAPWTGPMRLELASGAVLLIEKSEQMAAIPSETTFEPTNGRDAEGREVYREIAPQKAALAILSTMGEELKAAATALFTAAHVLKESSQPFKASQAHQAALRAMQAHQEIVGQD